MNRFGSGCASGHQAVMRFEKLGQPEDETIDSFMDDLEMLKRRSQPDELISMMNLAVASNFIDGEKNEELRKNNVSDALYTYFNHCTYTGKASTEVRGISITEAYDEIKLVQKILMQF